MKKTLIITSIFTCIYGQIALSNTYNSIISNEHNKYEVVEKVVNYNHSCQDILNSNQSVGDGFYDIYLDNETTFEVYCDMTTDGGGWTRLDNSSILNDIFSATGNHFSGETTWVDDKLIYGDVTAASGHDRSVTLNIPFTYQEFYLKDYKAKSYVGQIENSDDITNTNWNTEIVCAGWGDIAFGSRDLNKPTMSYSQQGEKSQIIGEIPFPNENIYNLGVTSDKFTIRSVEGGGEREALYVWYSGYVYLR